MTEQAKHTPGPWQAEDGLDEPTVESEDFVVASCHQASAMAEGESIANARLIAAAPEMAEALRNCKIFMEECLETEVQSYRDNPEIPTADVGYFERELHAHYQQWFDMTDCVLQKAGVLAEGTGS